MANLEANIHYPAIDCCRVLDRLERNKPAQEAAGQIQSGVCVSAWDHAFDDRGITDRVFRTLVGLKSEILRGISLYCRKTEGKVQKKKKVTQVRRASAQPLTLVAKPRPSWFRLLMTAAEPSITGPAAGRGISLNTPAPF
jgi:hypothetical protein